MRSILANMSGMSADDKRAAPSIDILNELLSCSEFLNRLHEDDSLFKEYIDSVITSYR